MNFFHFVCEGFLIDGVVEDEAEILVVHALQGVEIVGQVAVVLKIERQLKHENLFQNVFGRSRFEHLDTGQGYAALELTVIDQLESANQLCVGPPISLLLGTT